MAISSYKTKNGSRYRAIIWIGNKPVKEKAFTRKLDAVEWHRRQSILIQDGQVGRLKGEKMNFEDFFNQVYWINKDIRPGTAVDYLRIFKTYLKPAFGHRRIMEIEPIEWSSFIHGLVFKGMSKARANRVHAVASATYSMAVKWNYVSSNPLCRVDYFETDLQDFDYWTESEVTHFLNWAYSTGNPRFALYQAAYETGMRVSELIALQRDCVDLANGIITVRRAHCKASKQVVSTTKSGEKRILGINAGLKATLQKLLDSHESDYVFCDKKKLLSYHSIRHQFGVHQEKAQARRISFHDLRHTFASHYVMRGGSIYDLKELLGHADIETTMSYAHLAPDHLRKKSSMVSFQVPVKENVVALAQSYPNHKTGKMPILESLTGQVQTDIPLKSVTI